MISVPYRCRIYYRRGTTFYVDSAPLLSDFVIALYNPVSKRRKTQLALARDILLASRDPQTPVALARNVGRDGEAIDVISLAELTADKADMLTIVLVGNSQTRLIERGRGRWLYTPRGYEPKLARASNNEN